MEVHETIEHKTLMVDGKPHEVTITRRVGLDTYQNKAGLSFLADEATFIDWGPKLGCSRTFSMHPEVEPTEEERAAGRQRMKDIAVRCLYDQGIWT